MRLHLRKEAKHLLRHHERPPLPGHSQRKARADQALRCRPMGHFPYRLRDLHRQEHLPQEDRKPACSYRRRVVLHRQRQRPRPPHRTPYLRCPTQLQTTPTLWLVPQHQHGGQIQA